MFQALIKKFVKDPENTADPLVREQYGTLCGVAGIICNIVLFLVKAIMGILANSVSVTADAFNNLSDVGSSVVSLFGFKIASKPADAQHPFGHGRVEYVSGLIISFIIMMVGVEFIKSSIDKIFHPDQVVFSVVVLAALVFSICVKLWLSRLNRMVGKKIHSSAMAATAVDSLSDVITTSVTMISIISSLFTDWPVDGLMGVVVALFVLYSGFNIAKDTISPLLGQAPDPEVIKQIETIIVSNPPITGVHDIIVHNYGPGRIMASAHAEVPADADILVAHDIIDTTEKEIQAELKIPIVIHLDPIDTNCEKTNQVRMIVEKTVAEIDPNLTIHDFRMVWGQSHTNLVFDVMVPFDAKPMTNEQLKKEIDQRIQAIQPNFFTVITFDRSYI